MAGADGDEGHTDPIDRAPVPPRPASEAPSAHEPSELPTTSTGASSERFAGLADSRWAGIGALATVAAAALAVVSILVTRPGGGDGDTDSGAGAVTTAAQASGSLEDVVQLVVRWPSTGGECSGPPIATNNEWFTIDALESSLSFEEDPRRTASRLGGAVIGPAEIDIQIRNNGNTDLFLENIRIPVAAQDEQPSLDWAVDSGIGCGGAGTAAEYLRFDLQAQSFAQVVIDNSGTSVEELATPDFVGTRIAPGDSFRYAIEVISCGPLYEWTVALEFSNPQGEITEVLSDEMGLFRSVGPVPGLQEYLVVADRNADSGRALSQQTINYAAACEE
ncbi:MAG: hypothetical protein AAF467_07245 [Actinomycetota bacterium]